MTSCWIVTEGLAGTENQCIGVAEAMGLDPVVKRVGLRLPWKWLSPVLGFENKRSFTGDELTPPWPDILLTSGRKAVAAARYIKKAGDGEVFTVHIQDPRIGADNFDLVAVPAHDALRGENVIVTDGAPNRITPAKLEKARAAHADSLSHLPSPRVAIMIGGNSKTHTITGDIARDLAERLRGLADTGYGLMITASRRTGATAKSFLEPLFEHKNVYGWDGTGANPYFGFLSWADSIIVTEDSISMMSDAATTGKPLYIAPLAGGSAKFDRFHNHFRKRGIGRKFTGNPVPYDYEPLNDALAIAEAIMKNLNTGTR